MSRNMALLGSWGWYGGEGKSGIGVCEYNDGTFREINHYYPEAIVGSPCVVTKKGYVYFISEVRNTADLINEGGYAYCAKLNDDKLEPVNRIKTYSPNPCYCLLDTEEKYLIVVHHSSGRDAVTKIYRDENGEVKGRVDYNDAAIEMIEIKEDGSLGKIKDFHYHNPAFPGKRSFLHGVFSPEGTNVFIAVDKGLNSLYSYTIDYRNERLLLMDELELSYNCAPKYLCFVPHSDILYVGYELEKTIAKVRYNVHTGKMKHLGDFDMQCPDLDILGTQDLVVNPDNQNILYINFYEYGPNGHNLCNPKQLNNSWSQWSFDGGPTAVYVGVYDISDQLNPILIQKIRVADNCARRFQITPDHKYLLTLNTECDSITKLKINEDGTLVLIDKQEWYRPENIYFYSI